MTSGRQPIHRIFISSTAEDLKEHREAAGRAVEKLGHKADYFERTWTARERLTLEESRRGAAEADAVVVLLAHRYGWVPSESDGGDGRKSVTWHEYDAAIAAGKPVFAFLVDESAPWTARKEQDRIVDDPDKAAEVAEAIRRLKEFRAELSRRPYGLFSTPDNLAQQVVTAVSAWLERSAAGSVRAGSDAEVQVRVDPAESRALSDYLRDHCIEWRQLPLAGIDPEQTDAASQTTQPRLDEVYVGLNVVEPRPEPPDAAKRGKKGDRPSTPNPEHEQLADHDRTPWTALDACSHHRRAVILGDPGSGKSTFLRIVALGLAERFQGAAVSTDQSPPWPFDRPLLPVVVTVRDLAHDLGAEPVEHRISGFIERTLAAHELAAAAPAIKRMLRDGDAILMLDGLDEIAQSERRADVIKAIEAFVKYNKQTRVLVTCRVAAYTVHEVAGASAAGGGRKQSPADWRLSRDTFPVVTLASFNEGQQHQFVDGWYRELKSSRRIKRDPVERAQSLQRALKRSHLRRLASNPLLLTVMALVHASAGNLPDQRVLLYREAVETLLRRWRQGRDPGSDSGDTESVGAVLDEIKTTSQLLERQLWELASNVHAGTADADGDAVADIPHAALCDRLCQLHHDPDKARPWATRLIEALKHRSGLLIERRWGVFTFPHRTFQEYLAARHMAIATDPTDEAMKHRGAANDLWREVILMVGGTFAHLENNAARGLPLVDALLKAAQGEGPTASRRVEDLVLAADLMCEMTPSAVRAAYGGPKLTNELAEALQAGMFDGALGIKERARLGSALGRLGDPRAGVADRRLSESGVQFPEIAPSLEIPAGPFPMGNDKPEAEYDWETPRFTCTIAQPFRVSLHPITVAQYQMFIDAGGYKPEVGDGYWTTAGLAWRTDNDITGPELYDDVFQSPNHPQVGVSWYEAMAFCRWLTEVSGQSVRLPTEPEWERAARHTDARMYPWGNAPRDEHAVERANINESIGHTTPVGLYATGAADCTAIDMAGNVWEWCQTAGTNNYVDYPRESTLDDEEVASPRVVRGGSWDDLRVDARCASRGWCDPAVRYDSVGFRVCVCPCSPSGL